MSVSKSRKLFELRKQEQKIQTKAAWASGQDKDNLLNSLYIIREKIKSLSV